MPLILSDAGLAVVTAVAGRLPLRLRGAFLQELAAAFAGHEGEGLHRLAVEAAKRVVKIEAAESRGSVVPAAHRAERRRLVERLRALQAEARECPDGATKAAMVQAREALRLFDGGRSEIGVSSRADEDSAMNAGRRSGRWAGAPADVRSDDTWGRLRAPPFRQSANPVR
jgi:hypothetical protein